MNTERTRGAGHRGRAVLILTLAAAVGSCSSPTDTTVLAWEGELAAVGPAGPNGSVALLSQYGRTEASIEIRAALPDTTYAWRINQGTCDDEGPILGGQAVYPGLATDENGGDTRNTTIAGAPDSRTPYAARVLLPDAQGSVVACGELDRVSP